MSSDDGVSGLTGLGRRHGAGAGRQECADAPAVEVSHLAKDFGGRAAVADVSFSVARGEVFGFLGPNGAGKTTTVRMLGTLVAPTSGSAAVAGIPLAPEKGVAGPVPAAERGREPRMLRRPVRGARPGRSH